MSSTRKLLFNLAEVFYTQSQQDASSRDILLSEIGFVVTGLRGGLLVDVANVGGTGLICLKANDCVVLCIYFSLWE